MKRNEDLENHQLATTIVTTVSAKNPECSHLWVKVWWETLITQGKIELLVENPADTTVTKWSNRTAPILGQSETTCHLIRCSKDTIPFLWHPAQNTSSESYYEETPDKSKLKDILQRNSLTFWKMSRSQKIKKDWGTTPDQRKVNGGNSEMQSWTRKKRDFSFDVRQ